MLGPATMGILLPLDHREVIPHGLPARPVKGRGSVINPDNRFETMSLCLHVPRDRSIVRLAKGRDPRRKKKESRPAGGSPLILACRLSNPPVQRRRRVIAKAPIANRPPAPGAGMKAEAFVEMAE